MKKNNLMMISLIPVVIFLLGCTGETKKSYVKDTTTPPSTTKSITPEKESPSVISSTSDQGEPLKTPLIVTQRKTTTDHKDSLTNSIGMEFVYIPPGTFIMGSPPDEYGHEDLERQHQVTLSKGFYMQKTEVTQKQWKTIMGYNPSHFLNCGENCPVEQVSWYDVQEFIRKLNEREKTKKYRLPTEAEWEYACRAGTNTAFSNGTITKETCGYNPYLDAAGWYYRNSEKGTHGVAQKQANPWGLYDMHGNVWEWCQDWQRKYSFYPVVDPVGPPTGLARIRRGGGWSHYPLFCRSAYRSWLDPDKKTPHVGFRLARSLVEPESKIAETPIPQPAGDQSIKEHITIQDVNFDLDSFEIKEDMIPVLEKVVEILKGRTEDIVLAGHTCSLASEDYNRKLSEHRAASVKAFLINNGIPGSRIETVGYGKKMPKYNNLTDEGRRLNRRVEIHLKESKP